MVDFGKRNNRSQEKTHPVEIYNDLDRRSITGSLRMPQESILKEWYTQKKSEKDIIIKLNTGEGKTLIGLLILQSKINSKEGPCLFICPNKYLVQQVQQDAKKFGINYCSIEPNGKLPSDFSDGKKILITHVQKVFNGKTIFGLDNQNIAIGSLILDDSHACIDSIKKSFTIELNNKSNFYKEIFELFKDVLPEQGEGTFLEIEDGEYGSFLPISYWNWIEKADETLQIISKYRKNENNIMFVWPFIKDNIRNYQAFISGDSIEMSPLHIPIERFTFFTEASQRVLMSATTQDDSFFIKGLGLNISAIKDPMHNPDKKWSGEKMLLIPSLIDNSIDRNKIINELAKPSDKDYGVVSLVPSFAKASLYSELGALVPDKDNVDSIVHLLKNRDFKNTVVFANRYDGIDLPDETCRILIIDGLPYFFSMSDKYEESNRKNSELINIKIAQKIEQGLGRSVRGERDYSLIYIIGSDLVQFIKGQQTKKYFSSQTKKQVDIGIDIADFATEELSEEKHPYDAIKELMNQSINRDQKWKDFYNDKMSEMQYETNNFPVYEILELEREAAHLNYIGQHEDAGIKVQEIIDKHCNNDSEKAWYLQLKARYIYLQSKVDSNNLQTSAFKMNQSLLKPKKGFVYKKLDFINENRVKRILKYVKGFADYENLILENNTILSDLKFGVSADKFELALQKLGVMLGFMSERPDKEIKKGPDNLWCGGNNQYFIFECKSEVNISREQINKKEVGQMNNHCAWFQDEYGVDAFVKRILVIPTRNVSNDANFSHDVEITRRAKLKSLRSNVESFWSEFIKYKIDSITDESIQNFLNVHKLDIESLINEYTEKYYKKA